MNFKQCLILFLSFGTAIFTFGQEKYEKEYRIKKEEVPESAKSFVILPDFNGNVKWYFEENLTGNSIEAKFKYQNKKYSIEFDTTGKLQDIEIETTIKSMPGHLTNKIISQLDSLFVRHKTRKIQLQYSGNIQSIGNLIKNKSKERHYSTNYEFVVKGKVNKLWQLYEITFNDKGSLITKSRIVFRNTDNLEF